MLNLVASLLLGGWLVCFTAAPVVQMQPRSASPLAWLSSSEAGRSQEPRDLLSEAKSLTEKNMAADAEPLVRQYLDKHPDSAPGHFLLGYILFAEIREHPDTNSQAARLAYTEKIKGAPGDKFTEEKARASLAEYTEGAKYATPSATDLRIVGLDYVLLGDYNDASKWFEKMLQWNPGDAEGWYYLGRTKYNQNRFEDGVRAFEKSLELEPRNVKTEDNLGLSLLGLGRTGEAMKAFRQAIEWQGPSPKNPGPFIDLAGALLDQNLSEEAIPYLRMAIEISSEDSKSHELLGKAYSRLDRLPEAREHLEKAVALTPEVASLHCMLAPVYRKLRLDDKAEAEFARCSALTAPQPLTAPN
jgi:tetratricopeptide (TPR) repeat protein